MIQKNHDLKGRHKAPKYCLTICCRVFSARKVGPSQETYFSTGKIHVVFCKYFINLMNTHLIGHFYHTSKLIYQFFSFFDSSIQYRLSAYIVHTLYDGIRVMCKWNERAVEKQIPLQRLVKYLLKMSMKLYLKNLKVERSLNISLFEKYNTYNFVFITAA